ncbi:MAG: endonuclease/exonuclease/phosphatase family protein [Nitrospirota bacterium]|nr:endonuclease/exonuclease/phosphatase family protein [Nitrospirota bacterium]
MRNFLTLISFIFFLVVGSLSFASAQDFQVGQSVILEAKKPIGVPLHREASPSYLKHVPSGTSATIQRIAQDGHWLSVQLASGEAHWVHRKYVQANTIASTPIVPSKPSSPKTPSGSKTTIGGEHEVWTSKEQCQTAIQKGLRMVEPSSAKLRVATWNLRWFPVGAAPDQPEGSAEPTDLDWLICTLRWMQVDILAMQESLATPEATQAWETLTNQLSKHTGDTWRWHRQPCGRPGDHHLGLLWNDSRVALSKFDSLWQFNSKATSARNPCTSGLRPGQYAFVQSRQKNGADFHLIAVHLKSGPTVFAVEQRQKAFNRIDKAVAPLLGKDHDVVILGDFNTMGAGDRQSQLSELKYLRRFVAKEKPGFTDLPVHLQCSQYFRGRGGQLDHVLVANGMKEIDVESVQVTGYCALAGCQRIRGDYPLAYRRLSDHCPVILEITNRNDD